MSNKRHASQSPQVSRSISPSPDVPRQEENVTLPAPSIVELAEPVAPAGNYTDAATALLTLVMLAGAVVTNDPDLPGFILPGVALVGWVLTDSMLKKLVSAGFSFPKEEVATTNAGYHAAKALRAKMHAANKDTIPQASDLTGDLKDPNDGFHVLLPKDALSFLHPDCWEQMHVSSNPKTKFNLLIEIGDGKSTDPVVTKLANGKFMWARITPRNVIKCDVSDFQGNSEEQGRFTNLVKSAAKINPDHINCGSQDKKSAYLFTFPCKDGSDRTFTLHLSPTWVVENLEGANMLNSMIPSTSVLYIWGTEIYCKTETTIDVIRSFDEWKIGNSGTVFTMTPEMWANLKENFPEYTEQYALLFKPAAEDSSKDTMVDTFRSRTGTLFEDCSFHEMQEDRTCSGSDLVVIRHKGCMPTPTGASDRQSAGCPYNSDSSPSMSSRQNVSAKLASMNKCADKVIKMFGDTVNAQAERASELKDKARIKRAETAAELPKSTDVVVNRADIAYMREEIKDIANTENVSELVLQNLSNVLTDVAGMCFSAEFPPADENFVAQNAASDTRMNAIGLLVKAAAAKLPLMGSVQEKWKLEEGTEIVKFPPGVVKRAGAAFVMAIAVYCLAADPEMNSGIVNKAMGELIKFNNKHKTNPLKMDIVTGMTASGFLDKCFAKFMEPLDTTTKDKWIEKHVIPFLHAVIFQFCFGKDHNKALLVRHAVLQYVKSAANQEEALRCLFVFSEAKAAAAKPKRRTNKPKPKKPTIGCPAEGQVQFQGCPAEGQVQDQAHDDDFDPN